MVWNGSWAGAQQSLMPGTGFQPPSLAQASQGQQLHSGGTLVRLELGAAEPHVCSRECTYEHLFGNVHRCKTSGTTHVCDQMCQQRLYYDRWSTICRLSKKIFPNSDVAMGEAPRKRCGDDVLLDGQSKRRVLGECPQHARSPVHAVAAVVQDPSCSNATSWLGFPQ